MARARPPRYIPLMPPVLLVALGGALGSSARYGFGRAMLALIPGAWPWGTFGVNLVGGLLIGALSATIGRGLAAEPHRLLLGVGVLGGFTTFSSFSLETAGMLSNGETARALGYICASVFGSILALYAGAALVRAL